MATRPSLPGVLQRVLLDSLSELSDQQLLASRTYGVAMLRSGKLDEFTVTTHSGVVYVLRYWGGTCADLDAAP